MNIRARVRCKLWRQERAQPHVPLSPPHKRGLVRRQLVGHILFSELTSRRWSLALCRVDVPRLPLLNQMAYMPIYLP